MEMQTFKGDQLRLQSAILNFERHNGSLKRVTIIDTETRQMLVLSCDYSMSAVEPVPPKLITTHEMVVTLNGTKVTYRSEDVRELEQKAEALAHIPDCVVSEIKEIQILETEAKAQEEIPF